MENINRLVNIAREHSFDMIALLVVAIFFLIGLEGLNLLRRIAKAVEK